MENLTFLVKEISKIVITNSSQMNNSPKNNSYISKSDEIFALLILIILILSLCFCFNNLDKANRKKANEEKK